MSCIASSCLLAIIRAILRFASYQQKASEDFDHVTKHVHRLLETYGQTSAYVSDSMIREMCRNAAFLSVINYRSIDQELEEPNVEMLRWDLPIVSP